MKVGITGHTKGLGKFLFDYYKSQNHSVIGFSRSTGYDVSTDIEKIVSESNDLDLFINNAYSGTKQADLTKKLLDKVKFLVVSGSDAVTRPSINCSNHSQYISDKLEVAKVCHLASMSLTTTNILHLKMPFMENSNSNAELKISFLEIARSIDFWLTCPNITEVRYQWKLTDIVYKELEEKNKSNLSELESIKIDVMSLK
jgi:hypothetical protein